MPTQTTMYRYTFTWSDGEVTVIEAETQWVAQNRAYWERFGNRGVKATAELVSKTTEAVSA